MFKDSGKHTPAFSDLSPVEVKLILDSRNSTRLIDVREEWENKIAKIEGSELMPLSNFMSRINELNKDDDLIFYCHKGVRSTNVCNYLANQGFRNLINLKGGIDAWSDEVDQSVPKY